MKSFARSSRQSRAIMNSILRNLRKRLTPTTIIVIIFALAVVYICSQMFSLRVINDHDQKFASERLQPRNHPKDIQRAARESDVRRMTTEILGGRGERSNADELTQTKIKYSPRKQKAVKVQKSSPARREQAELRDKENKVKEEIMSVKNIRPKDMPRGVNPSLVQHYMKNTKSKFTCIKTKEVVSFSRVNDDYCDCSDGSDEPGTSACPNTSFYCDYQLKDSAHFIPSSRVNDGICDCCDGSDEWNNVTVPNTFKLHGHKRKYLVSHAPCEDTCKLQEKAKVQLLEVQLKGIQLKKEYMEEAKKYPIQNSKKFGPGGIFYKLSLKCYEWQGNEYEFAVCPFKHVKQQKFPSPAVDLGHFSEWVSARPGKYQLIMTGGDSQLCPNVGRRQTLITFQCGSDDKVLQVREDEKCKYVVDFASPAAC